MGEAGEALFPHKYVGVFGQLGKVSMDICQQLSVSHILAAGIQMTEAVYMNGFAIPD